jgi:hypothetical protein
LSLQTILNGISSARWRAKRELGVTLLLRGHLPLHLPPLRDGEDWKVTSDTSCHKGKVKIEVKVKREDSHGQIKMAGVGI